MKAKIDISIPNFTTLEKLTDRIDAQGKEWVEKSSQFFYDTARDRLATQGRGGNGNLPPLAASTIERYNRYGWPDGSALYNKIELNFLDRFHAVVGIPDGKPSLIAAVQNDGAVIKARNGNTFYVPGRKFWSTANKWTRKYAKKI